MERETITPFPTEQSPARRSLRATFDDELDALRDDVLRLGGRVERRRERQPRRDRAGGDERAGDGQGEERASLQNAVSTTFAQH